MKKNKALTVSLIAVVLGILLGFVVVIATGRNPINMIYAIVKMMTGYDIPSGKYNIVFVLNWFLESMPLILTGLSVAFAYRTGLFNIGAEGQYMVGSTAAAACALLITGLPPIVHVTICILAGAIAGAVWGFIPGFLKAFRNIHEVVICIMFNYIALYLSNYFVRYWLPIDTNTNQRSIGFPDSAILKQITGSTTSQFNWGFVIVIIALVAVWFIIEKTTFGFSLKATGFNKDAASYSGMKVNRNIVYSMMISGALSGAAGAIVVLGTFKYGRIFASFDNYGFNGIPVALVGAANAVGVGLAGFLFGLLKVCMGSFQLYSIPKEISELIQASIIYLVAIQFGIIYVLDKIKQRKLNKTGGNQ